MYAHQLNSAESFSFLFFFYDNNYYKSRERFFFQSLFRSAVIDPVKLES